MKIAVKTIEKMASAGIQFYASIPHPAGSNTIFLSSYDIPEFIEDSDLFVAKSMKVSKSEYLEWLNTFGTPRCGAMTRNGTQCKNLVSGGIQFPIEEWLNLDDGLCAVHGGESSQDARAKRRASRC